MPIVENTKSFARRVLWISYQIFWKQLFPVASGIASKAVVRAIHARVFPNTTSPFVTGQLLRAETIDGAITAGLMPNRAWAKYAIPKGLPKDKNRSLAIENDPHFVDDFDGVIKEGYGKGTKSLLLSDRVIVKVEGKSSIQKINYHLHDADVAGLHYDIVVTGIKPGTKQWELNIPRGLYKGRYAFVTTSRGMIITPMTDHGVRMAKPDYTLRKEELLTDLDPSKYVIERKVDGSLGNAFIKDQRVAFRSHREGGETYYDKLPAVEFVRNESPFAVSRYLYSGPSLSGTVLQGELVHEDGAARVSGILNSLAPNARAIQLSRGPVKYQVWDVLKYKGRDVSGKTYGERRAFAEQIVNDIRRVNKNWSVVEKMSSDETPAEFYARVILDPLPWGEGIVVKPINTSIQKWDKLKMTGFDYFKLVEVLEGEGKYANSVGRMLVENLTTKAQGEVGSLAVPDQLRSWIWNNRDVLEGQVVKVRSQEVTSRGVPRAGVFHGFHQSSELPLLMYAEGAVGDNCESAREVMYAIKSAAGWRRK